MMLLTRANSVGSHIQGKLVPIWTDAGPVAGSDMDSAVCAARRRGRYVRDRSGSYQDSSRRTESAVSHGFMFSSIYCKERQAFMPYTWPIPQIDYRPFEAIDE